MIVTLIRQDFLMDHEQSTLYVRSSPLCVHLTNKLITHDYDPLFKVPTNNFVPLSENLAFVHPY